MKNIGTYRTFFVWELSCRWLVAVGQLVCRWVNFCLWVVCRSVVCRWVVVLPPQFLIHGICLHNWSQVPITGQHISLVSGFTEFISRYKRRYPHSIKSRFNVSVRKEKIFILHGALNVHEWKRVKPLTVVVSYVLWFNKPDFCCENYGFHLIFWV